jgi:hypothetical protein
MNLFVLDEDPKVAAAGLDDKRLGSALMEACTMVVEGHGKRGRGCYAAQPIGTIQ